MTTLYTPSQGHAAHAAHAVTAAHNGSHAFERILRDQGHMSQHR